MHVPLCTCACTSEQCSMPAHMLMHTCRARIGMLPLPTDIAYLSGGTSTSMLPLNI